MWVSVNKEGWEESGRIFIVKKLFFGSQEFLLIQPLSQL